MDRITTPCKEKKASKAMIISIGGSPGPIIKTILNFKPEYVSFFSSQDTFGFISEIKLKTGESGIKISAEVTIVEDVNNLVHCHEKAEEAIERVVKKGFQKNNIIVDYTGGTKNMSVALALASITHGFLFSYVGGDERTKSGVGTVIDGKERVYESVNPWDFFAIEERRKIALLFNHCQYQAARELMERLLEKSVKYHSLFKKMIFLLEGYRLWDLFRHADALHQFDRARIDEIIESNDSKINDFGNQTIKLMPMLHELAKKGKPNFEMKILDLYANAERRFKEGKIDDAILRLYRVTEMIAQQALMENHGIDPSDVSSKKIPDSIREGFINKYRDSSDNKIKVPQSAAFTLLRELGDPLGIAFDDNKSVFLKIQQSRNNSYLAHGFKSSKKETYKAFREFVLKLGAIDTKTIPTFPEFGT